MKQKPVLVKDNPLDTIDGEICRVIKFTPHAKIVNNKVVADSKIRPYAFLTVEAKKLSGETELPVFHQLDFKNIFEAFEEKKEDQEVLIIWTKKHYKNIVFKLFSSILPRIIVWLCNKESYELIHNQGYKPKLQGEARFIAERPIKEWKPEVMD